MSQPEVQRLLPEKATKKLYLRTCNSLTYKCANPFTKNHFHGTAAAEVRNFTYQQLPLNQSLLAFDAKAATMHGLEQTVDELEQTTHG